MPNHPLRTLLGKFRILALAAVVLLGAGALRADDDAVLAEMKQKALVIQKQMAVSIDAEEQLKLQGELKALMEATLPKLSPSSRALFEVSLKVIQPLQELTAAYMRKVGDFVSSSKASFTSITSPQDIDERVAGLDALIAQNEEVLVRLNNFETDCEKHLATSTIDAELKRGFMIGVNRGFGRQVGPMRAIRNLDTQAYRQMQKTLQYLKQNWGKWKAGTDTVQWDDLTLENGFIALTDELHAIVERQAKAQQVLIERVQGR